MTCDRCGSDVLRHFAGSIEVLRHAVPPRDAHYPRVPTSRPAPHQPSVPPIDGADEGQPRQPETAALPEPASPAA